MTDLPTRRSATLLVALALCTVPWSSVAAQNSASTQLDGSWRAQLDLAGGPLRFHIVLGTEDGLSGRLCNADTCDPFTAVTPLPSDSLPGTNASRPPHADGGRSPSVPESF